MSVNTWRQGDTGRSYFYCSSNVTNNNQTQCKKRRLFWTLNVETYRTKILMYSFCNAEDFNWNRYLVGGTDCPSTLTRVKWLRESFYQNHPIEEYRIVLSFFISFWWMDCENLNLWKGHWNPPRPCQYLDSNNNKLVHYFKFCWYWRFFN